MDRSRRWYLILGGLLVAAVLFVAIFADRLTPVSPDYSDAKTSILLGAPPFPPSAQHLLGTDEFGRDVWSRVAYGARWSLFFALLIMTGRMLVAMPMAFLGAYGPKRFGWLVERFYVMTSAIPPLLIYLLLLSHPQIRLIGLWPSVVLTVTLLTIMEWPRLAVTLKGRIDQLLAEPFVEGAVAAGGSRWHIFRTHLLPHLWPTVLHQLTSELARSLVVIAQLAIFGVMVGGGVLIIQTDGRGRDTWFFTTGIPEWGSLLSDGRGDILTRPWIAFPPAFAFLTGVVGFNMLSQGLETLRFSAERVKAATTGRLSKWWRWSLVLIPMAAALWYYQGLPWGQEAAIAELALYQAQRLSAKDVDGFLGTIGQVDRTGQSDRRRWAAEFTKGDFELVGVSASRVIISGARATASWTVTVGYKNAVPQRVTRKTELVRRWGRWYETGLAFHELRGYYTDTEAVFDPVDPSVEAVPLRWNVHLLATVADHAFERAIGFAGASSEQLPRPLLRLYPSDELFREALGAGAPPDVTIWYAAGEPIRVSPDYLKGAKRWDLERSLSYEMVKFLTEQQLHQNRINPVLMGLFEQNTADDGHYVFYMNPLAGTPVLRLDDMFAMKLDSLTQARQSVFVSQSALLVDFLRPKLPAEQLPGPQSGTIWELTALAERLGTTVPKLTAEYDEYVYSRLAAESILNIPAARARVPEKLPAAVAARAKAATSTDHAQFLALTDAARRDDWSKWLAAAQGAGLRDYEAQLLDWDASNSTAHVLERLTLRDGRVIVGVVIQPWREERGQWVTGAVSSPFHP